MNDYVIHELKRDLHIGPTCAKGRTKTRFNHNEASIPREILNYSGKRGRYTRFYMRAGTLRDTVTKPIGKAETKVNIVTKVKKRKNENWESG